MARKFQIFRLKEPITPSSVTLTIGYAGNRLNPSTAASMTISFMQQPLGKWVFPLRMQPKNRSTNQTSSRSIRFPSWRKNLKSARSWRIPRSIPSATNCAPMAQWDIRRRPLKNGQCLPVPPGTPAFAPGCSNHLPLGESNFSSERQLKIRKI